MIREKYGHESLQLVRKWERKCIKLEKLKCDVKFLLKCKKERLIPTFARPKFSIKTNPKVTVKVSQLILETEIQNKYKLKKTLISETKQLSNQVGTVLSDIIYRGLLYKLRKAIDGKIRKWRMTHERKLQHLRAQLPVRNKQVLRKFVPSIIPNF